ASGHRAQCQDGNDSSVGDTATCSTSASILAHTFSAASTEETPRADVRAAPSPGAILHEQARVPSEVPTIPPGRWLRRVLAVIEALCAVNAALADPDNLVLFQRAAWMTAVALSL